MCAALEMSHFWINVIYCASWKIFTKEGIFFLFFLLWFYSTLTDSLCCQHQLICHGEKVTAVNAELFQKPLGNRKVGFGPHEWSNSLYSLFPLKFSRVISNAAILQRLVSGREHSVYFLVELLSTKMTVSAASSQPMSFSVCKLLFGQCNISKVFGPMSIRWFPSFQEAGLGVT